MVPTEAKRPPAHSIREEEAIHTEAFFRLEKPMRTAPELQSFSLERLERSEAIEQLERLELTSFTRERRFQRNQVVVYLELLNIEL